MEGEQPSPQGSPLAQNGPTIESGGGLCGQPEPETAKLKGTDFGDRSRWNKVISIVQELEKYGAHEQVAHILGLPEQTTWDDVEAYISNQDAVYVARAYGLPDDTPENVIDELLNKEDEEQRKVRARSVGLSEDARWDVISKQETAIQAKALGLPETVHHSEVWGAEKERKRKIVFEALGIQENSRWDWEDVLERALCISGSPPTAEDYVKRIQEVREWHIERVVKGDVRK